MSKFKFGLIVCAAGLLLYAVVFFAMPMILGLLRAAFPGVAAEGFHSTAWRTLVNVATVVISFVVFAVPGFFFGRKRPDGGWQWGLWLAVFPVIAEILLLTVVGVLYPMNILYSLLAIFAGGCLGAQLGAFLKQKPVSRTA